MALTKFSLDQQDSRIFNTVPLMVAGTKLNVGERVRTLGHASIDGGGGNDYEIVAACTGTHDNGSYIDLTGSGFQAKGLFPDGVTNVMQFGAVGDGTTNDFVAIQAAFDSLPSTGGVIEFPDGLTFGSESTGFGGDANGIHIINKDNITVLGNGATTKRLHSLVNVDHILTFQGCGNVTLENLNFDINGIEKFGGITFEANGRTIKDINVIGCSFVDSDPQVATSGDRFGLIIGDGNETTDITNVNITNCFTRLCQMEVNGQEVVISNSTFQKSFNRGIAIVTGGSNRVRRNFSITGCSFYDCADSFINLGQDPTNGNGNIYENINIIGNLFYNSGTEVTTGDTAPSYFISFSNTGQTPPGTWRNLNIVGNTFLDASGSRGIGINAISIAADSTSELNGINISDNIIYLNASSYTTPVISLVYPKRFSVCNNQIYGASVTKGLYFNFAEKGTVSGNTVECSGELLRFDGMNGSNLNGYCVKNNHALTVTATDTVANDPQVYDHMESWTGLNVPVDTTTTSPLIMRGIDLVTITPGVARAITNVAGGAIGKELTVIAGDGNTTFTASANMILSSTPYTMASGEVIGFMRVSGSVIREIYRG